MILFRPLGTVQFCSRINNKQRSYYEKCIGDVLYKPTFSDGKSGAFPSPVDNINISNSSRITMNLQLKL